jgi:hypothetical protein
MKKFLAIFAALALVLSFAACGAKTTDETTTEPLTEEITSEEAAPATEEAAAATEEAVATAEDATEATTEAAAPEDATETEAAATEEEATEAPKAPQTKEEIINYFNDSVNKVKTDAKAVTRNYSKITLAGSMTLPSSINGILKLLGGADEFVGGQLEKNSNLTPETYTGAQIKERYPVEGESYASKLTPADVQSATCTEKDGKYTITITTVPDAKSTTVTHGQGHAPKAFNTPLPATINENIPGVATGIVGTASMNYPSSTAKIVVDAKTGHVESSTYDICWTINFDKAGVILPFITHDSYTIKY